MGRQQDVPEGEIIESLGVVIGFVRQSIRRSRRVDVRRLEVVDRLEDQGHCQVIDVVLVLLINDPRSVKKTSGCSPSRKNPATWMGGDRLDRGRRGIWTWTGQAPSTNAADPLARGGGVGGHGDSVVDRMIETVTKRMGLRCRGVFSR